MRPTITLLAALSLATLGCQSGPTTPQAAEPTEKQRAAWAALERRDQSVSPEDLHILQRAKEILVDPSVWDREDDRLCAEDDTEWSLFCALQKASLEVLGEYQHRRVALQEVRFAIVDVSPGRLFRHRLMDFNNTGTFEDVHRVLDLAIERVGVRLSGR